MDFTRADYDRFAQPRYGTANPERIDNPMWLAAIRSGDTAYLVRKPFDDMASGPGVGTAFSSFREEPLGPVWTWVRFGRSSTPLADGRTIHVGGEHEDWYDLDFCIYNDVVVEHADGRFEIHGYPKDIFPPTDFHTATLIGDHIWIVGCLGYGDLRAPGETPVYRLDTQSLAIERVRIAGEGPGWLHRHWADAIGPEDILIAGGQRIELDGAGKQIAVASEACVVLDTTARAWRPIARGDLKLGGVDLETYRHKKSPRFGTANPERADNPFWSAMLVKGWKPRRARDLFSDPGRALSEREKKAKGRVQRPPGEIVWTAHREDMATLTLVDGRQIAIGGAAEDWGDDGIDNWVYSDIIVLAPDGTRTILLYPEDLFPALILMTASQIDGRIFVTGAPDHTRTPQLPKHRSIVLELDPATMALRRVGGVDNTPDDIIVGEARLDPDLPGSIVFPLIHRWAKDPVKEAILDLSSEIWWTRIVRLGA